MRLLVLGLVVLASSALTEASPEGQYKVTDAWPSGVGESFAMMHPQDKSICARMAQALRESSAGKALQCDSPFYAASALERPKWSDIDRPQLLSLAKRLEVLLDQPWQTRHWSDTPEFEQGAESRIAAGSLSIGLTRVTLAGSDLSNGARTVQSEKTTILKYQRWGCGDFAGTSAPRVVFFIVEAPDLSELRRLTGLGDPDDMYIDHGLAYFDARSARTVDSHWKKLPHPQPEVTVHEVMREDSFVQICRLLYWDSKR